MDKINMIEAKRLLIRAAKHKPCVDCSGIFHFSAMEFDHLPQFEKLFEISRWSTHTSDEIVLELAKCEVVCANCHRTRTANRHLLRKEVRPVDKKKQVQKVGRPDGIKRAAMVWLAEVFQDGRAHRSEHLILDAKVAGITDETLRRAYKVLGGEKPVKYGRFWYWRLNAKDAPNLFDVEE